MDFNKIFSYIADLPTYTWIVLGIISFILIFGDRKKWKYEAKFPLETGVGSG